MSSVINVFPASAGMNRSTNRRAWIGRGVPRKRGDEPGEAAVLELTLRCSPQARG